MLKIALMGCGRISFKHAEILGKKQVEGLSLVAVCDTDFAKAKKLGKMYSIPAYSNIEELISSEKVDIVSILTESGNHARHADQVAGMGKHVIVEKPMALTLDDADMMINSCIAAGVKLFVVKQNRFNIPIVRLRKAIESNQFGKIVLGTVRVRWCRKQEYYDQASWRGTWALDGGVLSNQASHHIDLLQWMLGDVETVFAKSTTSLVDIEAEDTAIVLLTFKSGALGVIEATTAVRPDNLEGSLSIIGEKGSVVVGGFAVNELTHWKFEDSTQNNEILEDYSVNPPDVYGFGHKAYYEHVVNCISKGKPNPVDGLMGRKSLELINAIYESIETKKEVNLRFSPKFCKLGKLGK